MARICFADEACAVYHQYGRQGIHVAVDHRAVEEYQCAVRIGDADNEGVQLLYRRIAVREDAPVFAAHHCRIAGNLRVTQHAHQDEIDVCVAACPVLDRFFHFVAV